MVHTVFESQQKIFSNWHQSNNILIIAEVFDQKHTQFQNNIKTTIYRCLTNYYSLLQIII